VLCACLERSKFSKTDTELKIQNTKETL